MRGSLELALVFIVMAVDTEQFPVAAVGGIVVVIVIAVVDRQLLEIGASELARAAPADPWIQLERLFPVTLFTLLAVALGISDDAVEPAGVRLGFPGCHVFSRPSAAPAQAGRCLFG